MNLPLVLLLVGQLRGRTWATPHIEVAGSMPAMHGDPCRGLCRCTRLCTLRARAWHTSQTYPVLGARSQYCTPLSWVFPLIYIYIDIF